jgi:hypothetical protein
MVTVTVSLAPGRRSTFLKPTNRLAGWPATDGSVRYTCDASAPCLLPVLVIV